LLLDFGYDTSDRSLWWIIFKDMTPSDGPARHLHQIIQMHNPHPRLSNCTSQVTHALGVLRSQLRIYVREIGVLPTHVDRNSVLFTFDQGCSGVKTARVNFWDDWAPMKVHIKVPAV
jgi:hypothetical protein